MAFAPRTWLHLACLWLSLAMVLGHALAPVGSPLARSAGSAFSASTSDVALGSVRAGLAKAKRTAIADDDAGASGGLDFLFFAANTPALQPPAFGAAPTLRSADLPPSFPRAHGFHARAPPALTASI